MVKPRQWYCFCGISSQSPSPPSPHHGSNPTGHRWHPRDRRCGSMLASQEVGERKAAPSQHRAFALLIAISRHRSGAAPSPSKTRWKARRSPRRLVRRCAVGAGVPGARPWGRSWRRTWRCGDPRGAKQEQEVTVRSVCAAVQEQVIQKRDQQGRNPAVLY
jgi:hypothetical protein